MQRVKEKDGGDGINRPLDALLHADKRTRDALPIGSLRNGLNQRGRHTSMYSFQEGQIGQHWIWCAVERIAAGEREMLVLEDYDFIPVCCAGTPKPVNPPAPDQDSLEYSLSQSSQ